MSMRKIVLLLASLLTLPASASAQDFGALDILSGIRSGGGWVRIPIEGGEGTFSTVTVPTAALSLAGCVNVWYGHSGSWEIEARESVLGSVLRISAEPGIGVPFEHDFGMQAQVDIDFRWSVPRDTTLMLWVGLDLAGEGGEQACDPDYGRTYD
jgi:hypothetical protein